MTHRFVTKIIVTGMFASVYATCEAAPNEGEDLFDLPLEAVMEMEVTSVGKREQRMRDVPAALYVLTQDDIRRSGATCIPEVLRLVPGLQVARLSTNQWAISSRGFNSQFSDKLLVLIDGRSVYTPAFSGVFWDMQDTLMQDIDRIEVIRGPGASVWGANAVNGVISVITKHARDTVGGLTTVGGGTEERAFGSVRYGEQVGDHSHLRVYAKGFERGPSYTPGKGSRNDEWSGVQAGFRLDSGSHPPSDTAMTLQGDMYGGALHSNYLVAGLDPDVERSLSGDESYGGGNVIGRVDHQWSDALSAQIQTYYDHAYRNDQVSDQQINTYDIDTTMVWKQSDRTTLTAGAGYRVIDDAIRGVDEIFGTFEPEHRNQAITNVFFQQDIALIPKSVTLTVGSKYERNNLTIAAFQPTVRMSWQVSAEHLIWAAWSRAKRFPSRLDLDSKLNLSTTRLPDGTPALVGIDGNRGFDGEGVYSHELGYRYVGEEGWSVDFAGFYSHYDALRDFRPGAPTPFLTSRGTALRLPNRIDTKGAANSYGLEIVASTRVTDSWRLEAWYSWIAIDDVDTAFPLDIITVASDMDVPEHQGFLRSNMTLSESVELDLMARFVDSLSGSGMASRYIEADVRFGWKAADGLVVSLVGQNLLDRSHKEFSDFLTSAPGAQRERGVYGQLEYRF